MRLITLLLAASLGAPVAGNAFAQSTEPAPPPAAASSQPAAASSPQDTPANLPVSVDRIKKQLEKPPALSLEGLRDQPTFRIEVKERNKLQDLISSLDFRSGPTPYGG